MFLKQKSEGVLVEVLNLEALINPTTEAIAGRVQAGQEEQDPEEFAKADLQFPSGEALPRCWVDAEYQASL